MRTALIVVTAVAALLAVQPSMAQAPPDRPDAEDLCLPGAAQHRIAEFLGLSDDQLAEWNGLIDARETAAAPVRDAIAAVQQQLEDLLAGNDPDPFEVGDLVIERHDLGQQLADIERTYVEGFDALLDDDQLGRYRFIRRAERAEPLFPAFRLLQLLPPHWR
jgi:Spy/CpxP family protein refolding chaperone